MGMMGRSLINHSAPCHFPLLQRTVRVCDGCSTRIRDVTRNVITLRARQPDWSNSNQTIVARRCYVAPLRLSNSRNMLDANLASLVAQKINPPAISADAMLDVQALDKPAAIEIAARGAQTASPSREYLGVIRKRRSCFPVGDALV